MTVSYKRKVLIDLLFFAATVFVAYLILRYALVWFLPFIISFAVAAAVNGLSARISGRIGISRRACSILLVVLLYAAVFCLAFFCGFRLIDEIGNRLADFPEFYKSNILPLLNSLNSWAGDMIARIAPQRVGGSGEILGTVMDNIGNTVGMLSEKGIDMAGNIIKNVPNFFMALIFTVISSLLIVADYGRITGAIYRQLPDKMKEILSVCKECVFNSLLKMLKAYFLMMLLTFAELSVGFMILGIEDFAVKAAVIAFVDFLPLLGISAVMIPWIIICIIKKDFYLAIGLSVVFLIVAVIRNFAEPKIVGGQIGLHPLVSLICFYVGLKLMGIIGIIVLPIAVIVLKRLNECQVIKLWKTKPSDKNNRHTKQ